jgi:hypothetical protein
VYFQLDVCWIRFLPEFRNCVLCPRHPNIIMARSTHPRRTRSRPAPMLSNCHRSRERCERVQGLDEENAVPEGQWKQVWMAHD